MWKKSIRARLTIYIVLPVMLAILTVGGVGFYSAYNEAQEIYDTELSHVASLMLSILRAEDQEEATHNKVDDDDAKVNPDIIELGNDFDETGERRSSKLAFRIWKNSNLLFYSKKAANFGDERVISGFYDEEIKGKQWRFYVLTDAKTHYTLEVAQKIRIRKMLISKVLTTIFSPLIFLLPIILFAIWLGLRTGIKPLLAISEAVKQRSSTDLTPITNSEPLVEITPLIDSINSLLANLKYALEKERRFTDFAAHELRTPIAIFKTQAQTALREDDDEKRRLILRAQVQAADRATNMVDQLLTLARLEHTDIPTEKISLTVITQDIAEERLPLAKQKQIDLRFEKQADISIQGNKELLNIILSNLIDNAIKYTPNCGTIIVTLSTNRENIILSVCDNGKGIPEDKLAFVTERFYRISSDQAGAGIGLTIVKRAATIMGAEFILPEFKCELHKDYCQLEY